MKKVFVTLIIIGLLGLILAGSYVWQLSQPVSQSDGMIVFEVAPGTTLKWVAKKLAERNLIRSARFFEWYVRSLGRAQALRAGEYAIPANVKIKELVSILSSGRSVEYVLTIQEGLNRFEIASLIEQQHFGSSTEFLKLTEDPELIKKLIGEARPSLEGYLFPDTYHLTKYTGLTGLIEMMVVKFNDHFNDLKMLNNWNRAGLSRHALVVLASIVEKETGAPEERPIISSVFHNRLQKGMRLQTDPTVIYGLWEANGHRAQNITKKDLMSPNRYNTYTFSGLPFGPISNPGADALKAAGLPAETSYLYFVSRNNGTHVFSSDYKGHRNAVQKFQKNRSERIGKSWRDLKKRNGESSVQ